MSFTWTHAGLMLDNFWPFDASTHSLFMKSPVLIVILSPFGAVIVTVDRDIVEAAILERIRMRVRGRFSKVI